MKRAILWLSIPPILSTCVGCGGTGGTSPTDSGQAITEQQAVDTAVEATKLVAMAALAVRPAADLQAIFETGFPPPVCPVIQTAFSSNRIDLVHDYGRGCIPDSFGGPVISGTALGQYSTSSGHVDFTLDRLAARDHAVQGSVRGTVWPGETTTLDLALDVGSYDDTWTGTARVDVTPAKGVLAVSRATLTIARSGMSYLVTLCDVMCDTRAAPELAPRAGSIRVAQMDPTVSVPAQAAVVDFATNDVMVRWE